MKTHNLKLFVLLTLMVILSSCATVPRSPHAAAQEQGIIWMATYNAEVADMRSVLENPNSLPEQREMAIRKRAILTKIWPWLSEYKRIVDGGGVPDENTTKMVNNFINELTVLAMERH